MLIFAQKCSTYQILGIRTFFKNPNSHFCKLFDEHKVVKKKILPILRNQSYRQMDGRTNRAEFIGPFGRAGGPLIDWLMPLTSCEIFPKNL